MIQSLFEHKPENEISYLNYYKSSFKEDTWQIISEVKKLKKK